MAMQRAPGFFGARSWNGFVRQVVERVHHRRKHARRKAHDGFILPQVGGISAAVTLITKIQAVLKIRDDGGTHAGGLENDN